ncbi:MAG: hypothetical protein II234_05225 [Clostridia bacterium]|nr:hypothetical protein [Clostridia bacterium]
MTDKEFLNAQLAAVERMKEMNSRSHFQNQKSHPMPPVPSFVNIPDKKIKRSDTSFSQSAIPKPPNQNTAPHKNRNQPQNDSTIGMPFFDKLLKDSDSALIIGLLLLLMSENADKKLLFALVYILL